MTPQAEKKPRWVTRLTTLASDLYWAVVLGLTFLALLAFFGGMGYVILHFLVKYW